MTYLKTKTAGTLSLAVLAVTSMFSLACDPEEEMHELEYASLAFGDGFEVEADVGRVIRTQRSSKTRFSFRTSEYDLSMRFDLVLDCAEVGGVARSEDARLATDDGRYRGELEANVVMIRGGTVHLEYFGILQAADGDDPLEVMGEIRARAEPY